MVGTPRCGVTGRVQRTESRYPLLCLHSVAPLNAARSSQRDDPTLKLQTVPPPACPSLKERKAHQNSSHNMLYRARRSRRFSFQLRNIRRKSTALLTLKRAEARAPVFMTWLLVLGVTRRSSPLHGTP